MKRAPLPRTESFMSTAECGAAWLYHDLYGHNEASAPWAKLVPTEKTPWLNRWANLQAWMSERGFPIAAAEMERRRK